MNSGYIGEKYAVIRKYLIEKIGRYLEEKSRDVNHQAVISDLAQRTELSGSYLYSLILANLIALLGLLTNSIAVVIGAMLISPLMGPIFSLGLAFTLGDLRLAVRAVRIIVVSILMTVFVAAFFTLLSPLKVATHEILARTRPNVYDLLIAVFAGAAGALALCTRRNYLFTTTGVAIATAVIPPLSVVGYGVGTWQPGIAAGGFLLFFTNLVAILLSSDVVFYFCRFRGSMAMETGYPARRRFQILGIVLTVISIPLVVTLVTDIHRANLTKRVESVLKARLNIRQHSRLTRVSIGEDGGKYSVSASINTIKYVDSRTMTEMEQELSKRLGKASILELEQVIVRSGAVDPPILPRTPVQSAPPPPETLASLRDRSMTRIREGCGEVEAYIAPFRIAGCGVSFSDRGRPIVVRMTIARDFPPDRREQLWLKTALEKKLAESVDLKVDTTPFLPVLGFSERGELDETSRKALEQLKRIIPRLSDYRVSILSPAGDRRSTLRYKRRAAYLKEYLVRELQIPAGRIGFASGNETGFKIRIEQMNMTERQ